MKQVHVQDPWAGLAYSSDREVITDLIARIQVLENRLRDLEMMIKAREKQAAEQQTLPEVERVGS